MKYSKWRGIKIWFCAGGSKLKGDMAIYRTFSILVHMWDAPLYRASPIWIKCDTCPYITRLPTKSNVRHCYRVCLPSVKCETRVIGAHLWFGVCVLNISSLTHFLPILSKISKHLALTHLPPSLHHNHLGHRHHHMSSSRSCLEGGGDRQLTWNMTNLNVSLRNSD
jgi:hypothetical protein